MQILLNGFTARRSYCGIRSRLQVHCTTAHDYAGKQLLVLFIRTVMQIARMHTGVTEAPLLSKAQQRAKAKDRDRDTGE